MFRTLIACAALLLTLSVHGTETALRSQSLSQLEQQLAAIDAELEQLAHFSLRSGMGTIGYRSHPYSDPSHLEWVQIDLEPDSTIDQVVLVPTISRDTKNGFRSDGFPLEFRILIGNEETSQTIASFSADDQHLPRIAPLVINIPPTRASWIRLEATTLSPRAFDGQYNLELSEILVFNRQTNIALHRPVDASREAPSIWSARKREYLVDGFMPYLMDAAKGAQSIAFVSKDSPPNEPSSITIDLETTQSLDTIHLHSVDSDDTIPQSAPPGFGIPRHFIVEGASQPDFSDARTILEYQSESNLETGPIMMWRFEETLCRFVRLLSLEPFTSTQSDRYNPRIGFAEIELLSNGENIALGKAVRTTVASRQSNRLPDAITDGRNLYGKILPLRTWVNELANRHELETERPLIIAELNIRYSRQKNALRVMYGLSALLLIGIGFTILLSHLLRTRSELALKKRIAADLHDELGANLHTIGMLSDLADESKDDGEELSILHHRIRSLTERTGIAVRHCTDMFEANELYKGLKTDMQRAAQRILAKVEHDIVIEGEELIESLNARTLFDLFLFYKESLTNISRHAEATRFTTLLRIDADQVQLTISDNGRGLTAAEDSHDIPTSLKRRARILKAKVSAESPPSGGTRITLIFTIKRKHRRKK